jgi:Uma2 family endonuclease
MCSMVEVAERRMTLAAFATWCEDREGSHELVDGWPRALTEATARQQAVGANVEWLIRRLLPSGDVHEVQREVGVAIGRGDTVRLLVPDIVVATRTVSAVPWVKAPLMIVEIEAPPPALCEKALKISYYAELPNVQELWLVKSGSPIVLAWQRHGKTLQGLLPQCRGQSFRSHFLGGEVLVDDFYEGIDFTPPPANPEAG